MTLLKRNMILLVVCVLLSGNLAIATTQNNPSLLSLFYKGSISEVVNSIDELANDETISYELLHLKARAAAIQFLQTDIELQLETNGRLTDENKSQLKQLAEACTKSFEQAFSKAPSDYQKICLTSEWWSMHVQSRYFADSEIMRQGIQQNMVSRRDGLEEKILAQTTSFKNKFRSILDEASVTQNWPNEHKDMFADLMSSEFSELAAIDIPDDVFKKTLNDMPFFVCHFMPNIDVLEKAEVIQNTMRWYLWKAITCTPTENAEKQIVEKQAKEFAKEITNKIDNLIVTEENPFNAAEYGEKFIKCYENSKDNRFVPYFKNILFEQDYNRNKAQLEKQFNQLKESWNVSLKLIHDELKDAEPEVIKKRIAKEQDIFATIIYNHMFNIYTLNTQPAFSGHIPGEFVQLSTSTMNDEWYRIFTVNKVLHSFPKYEVALN